MIHRGGGGRVAAHPRLHERVRRQQRDGRRPEVEVRDRVWRGGGGANEG